MDRKLSFLFAAQQPSNLKVELESFPGNQKRKKKDTNMKNSTSIREVQLPIFEGMQVILSQRNKPINNHNYIQHRQKESCIGQSHSVCSLTPTEDILHNNCINLSIHYLLLLTFKTSSSVRFPISFGREVNLLFATCNCCREVKRPRVEGKVFKLQKRFMIITNMQ